MKSVFISDLHLSSDHPEVYTAFEEFLNRLSPDVEALYILGDLFEVWIGDDDSSPFSNSVKGLLRGISDLGIELKVQRGNRDFMLGKKFAGETGAEILPDYHLFQKYGQRALLMHGDLLCTDDRDYQRFRNRVHSPVYNFILRNLPLGQRRKMARKWRMQSRDMNRNKPANIMDVSPVSVRECMQELQVETLIHGHTHRPDQHKIDGGRTRIVLGDWGDHIWWIEASSNGFELLSSPLSR